MGRVRLPARHLGEVGVQFDLVDRRNDLGLGEQPVEEGGGEVADADGPHPAIGEQFLQRAVGGHRLLEVADVGLVKDEEIEPFDPELADGLLEGVQGLVPAVVGDPDLGLEEDVLALDSALRQASPTSRSLP